MMLGVLLPLHGNSGSDHQLLNDLAHFLEHGLFVRLGLFLT
jgi:hypothetical protein